MNKELDMIKIRKEDLIDNPMTRVPVCFCLDTSGSMNTIDVFDGKATGKIIEVDGKRYRSSTEGVSRIDKMNQGMKRLFAAIRSDEVAQYSTEISIVTFDKEAKCILDFANIERQFNIPDLKAENYSQGNTFLGEGVNLALDILERRKQEYKESGVDYFQPWLILMTDGEANGSELVKLEAMNRLQTLLENKKIMVLPIVIGNDGGKETLEEFSTWTPVKLNDLKYEEFFEFMSNNLIARSRSSVGESMESLISGIRSWGEL
jgi:uncharacterized protein YegL